MITSVASGRAVASTVDMLALPNKLPRIALPPVIFNHGAGGDTSGTPGITLLKTFCDAGFVVASVTCLNLFGASPSDANVDAAIALARANGASNERAILVGFSMGADTSLHYAANNLAKVSCVIAAIPCIDVQNVVHGDIFALRVTVNTAWGRAAADTSTLPAGSDPNTLRTTLSAIPQQFWYANNDVGIDTGISHDVVAYAAAVGGAAYDVGALGHSVQAIEAMDHQIALMFALTHCPRITRLAG